MPLTHTRSLGAGPVSGQGSLSWYRGLAAIAGEPHQARADLGGPPLRPSPGLGHGPIACLVHLTDIHVADVQSPVRFEFLNRELADPRFRALVPVQRPQEALTAHAVASLVRTLNGGLAGPATGMPPRLVLTGGDSIDNAQWNELKALRALLDGGLVDLSSGGPGYEGVQSPDWPDDLFWVPDGGSRPPDLFRRDLGYPTLPGLLERALRPFPADGLRLPWLGCRGNHEAHCQGVGVVTPALAAAMTGSRKPVALPAGIDRDQALSLFISQPESFLAGGCREVSPDRHRRPVRAEDLVGAALQSGVTRPGCGPSRWQGRDGATWFVHDTRALRFIVLDTVCPGGSAAGCVDERQLAWLEDRLREVGPAAGEANRAGRGGGERLVVVVSHHGTDAIDSDRPHRDGTGNVGGRRVLQALLHCDNVVLWLNGHTHRHAIRARQDPAGAGAGLWEVTTASLIDWPCQARLIELFDAGRGILGIACTMVDHDAPLNVGGAETSAEMAALHRELAANAPGAGFGSDLPGTLLDRNVVLSRPTVFDLEPLTAAE